MFRDIGYQIWAVVGMIHALTTVGLLNQVMGERRITIPMYACMGFINAMNSLDLFLDPSLAKAFRLWGSMNTFILVRLSVVLMAFTRLDWNLFYTYSLVTAASLTFPLTLQHRAVYFATLAPVIYGPLHEIACRKLGWSVEDPRTQDCAVKDTFFHDNVCARFRVRKPSSEC